MTFILILVEERLSIFVIKVVAHGVVPRQVLRVPRLHILIKLTLPYSYFVLQFIADRECLGDARSTFGLIEGLIFTRCQLVFIMEVLWDGHGIFVTDFIIYALILRVL